MGNAPTAIIDAHQHLWSAGAPGTEWLDDPSLTPIRRTFGVDDADEHLRPVGITASVAVEARSSIDETIELLALADDPTTLPMAVVGWIDLFGDVDRQLERLRTERGGERLVGVRHQIQAESVDWLGRDDVRRGVEGVGSAGLAFDLVVRSDQLQGCAHLASDLGDVMFVLDHLGKPPISTGSAALDHWHHDLAALASCDNVVAKVSGLVTEARWDSWMPSDLEPVIAHAAAAFGADRLLFGTDWPVCTLAASPAHLIDATASLLESTGVRLDGFWGGNASDTYGLAGIEKPVAPGGAEAR